MALTSRENILKAGAVLIVLAFMFELFSMGGRYTEPSGQAGENQTALQQVTGVSVVEGTLLAYEPQIYVFNVDEKARAIVGALVDSGAVEYAAPEPDGSLALNLPKKADVTQIAAGFAGTNATLIARGRLRMPSNITFTTNTGTVSAEFRDVTIELLPDVPVGRNVTVRVTGTILDGKVTSYLAVPVSIKLSFPANATVVGYSPGHAVLVEVPWENRLFDDAALRTGFLARYPAGNFSIYRNSSVLVALENATFEQGYVVAKAADMLLINESFIDKARMTDDLRSANVLVPPYFPTTQLVLKFEGEKNVSFILDFVNYTSLADYREASLELPALLEYQNRTFELMDQNLTAIIAEQT
ncbi:MAG: hypothetical protein Q7T16_03935, partial [Candidatus Burarchaeum sp.]